jgi:WS/DGAT/MGAT family acyltransferase
VFLELEQSGVPMHIGAALIFDGSSLRDAHGAFDVRSVRSVLASRLHLAEKTRWRVEPVPLSGRYVWVDDDCFRLDYHFRHVALPPPGARPQLDAVSTDFFTRGLDLTRPLWEILVVDGLEDGRVAALCKFHHAMMDGLAGVELLNLLLRLEPSRQSETPYLWRARRQPGLRELVEGETRRRIGLARGAAQALLGSLRNPGASLDATRSHALGIAHTVRAMASPSTRLAFNEALGPSRAVEHFRIELGDVKRVRQRFGGTINEFVLALVAGGLRRYLQAQDWDVETLQARALIPVSTRSDLERGEFGNKIAVVVAELPVAEPDPVGRLEAACRASARTKQSRQALDEAGVAHPGPAALDAPACCQLDGHEHPRPGGAAVHPRRATARDLSRGRALARPGSQRRGLQLRRLSALWHQRGSGRRRGRGPILRGAPQRARRADEASLLEAGLS